MKKYLCILFSILLIIGSNSSAYAENMSPYYHSGACTAGTWSTESQHTLAYSSTHSYVCGGDVGVYFFTPSVGLQSSFVTSVDRMANFELREDDSVLLFTTSEHVRDYEAAFRIVNGLNIPYYFSCTDIKTGEIEDNGEVELFLKIYISTMPGDTSTSVPAGLVYYRFWAV